MLPIKGHEGVAKALLAAGANIEAKTKGGATPLMVAGFRKGNLEVVKVLIAAGADVNAKATDGGTLLYVAVCNGYVEIIKELLAVGAENVCDE